MKRSLQPFRAPAAFAVLEQLPAVPATFTVLNTQEATEQRDDALSQSVQKFQTHAKNASSVAAAAYLAHAGVHLLLWLRHIEPHAYIPKTALVDEAAAPRAWARPPRPARLRP